VVRGHASPAGVGAREVPVGRVTHVGVVVLGIEVAAPATLALIATATVRRTAVTNAFAVGRSLRIAPDVGALAHGDWVMLFHVALKVVVS
jgi:hypothetical protein